MTNLSFFRRVSIKDKALFTRAFSAMISAGLPLIKALTILAQQTKNQILKEALEDIIKQVEQGANLSSALSRHKNIFNEVYIASVQAAEASGKLERVLEELSDQQEKDYKLDSSVKGAIAYPVFIVCAMIVTAVILMVVVIPKLESVFTESGIALPLSTRILIGTANAILNYWYVIIIVILSIILFVRYYLRSESGQMVYGKMIIKLPVLNELFINIYMTRFVRTLGMLVNSGVPIIQSVNISAGVISNIIYQKILARVARDLERGIPMSEPLKAAEEFPPILSQMISVGEQTGKLDEILESLSGFFEEETAKRVGVITSLLEPILLVIVGIAVGLVVFAIIVPIYQISGSIK